MRRKYVNIILEFFGWTGVIAILIAYGLNSFGVIDVTSMLYLVLNIYGAAGIIVDAFEDRNYQPVVLNLVWLAVAIISLLRVVPFNGATLINW